MLVPGYIAPLDHHVIKGDKYIVDTANIFAAWQFVTCFSGLLVQVCKHIAHFVKSVYLLSNYLLQVFAFASYLFI